MMLRPRPRTHLALLFVSLSLGISCASGGKGTRELPYPPIESSEFGTMNNVSKMGPIWVGGMPTEEDLDLASRRGVRRIIDLSIPAERGACATSVACTRLGLEYLIAGLRPDTDPSDESVDLVLGWLRESLTVQPTEGGALKQGPIPTLMICGSGGRCSMFLAIFRVVDLGVPIKAALEEARRGGMLPGMSEEFVRAQVARLASAS